jgi:hypothetical protein
MSDTPTQASGGDGRKGAPDGVSSNPSDRGPGGESGGAAYPNPQTGKKGDESNFMGHGGQANISYHGTGQGGTDDDPEVGNMNAPAKDG